MAAVDYRVAIAAFACAACTSIAADARSFDGTRWHVLTVNRHVTPAKGDYQIEFRGGRISARFGCNSIGGAYHVEGDKLIASQLISTMMACGAPADGFESAGKGILNAPMKIRTSGNGKIRLSNSVGSIDLQRVP